MALMITRALVQLAAEPGSVTPTIVDYVLTDEADPALHKRGTITINVPAAVRLQIATLVEDTLHAAGTL